MKDDRHAVMLVEKVLAQVDMKNSPLKFKSPIVACRYGTIEVVCRWMVPDRDHGNEIEVQTGCALDWNSLCSVVAEQYIVDMYTKLVLQAFTHEMRESFHFRGERIYDPHAMDYPHSSMRYELPPLLDSTPWRDKLMEPPSKEKDIQRANEEMKWKMIAYSEEQVKEYQKHIMRHMLGWDDIK